MSERLFNPLHIEISQLETEDAYVDGVKINVMLMICADFQMVYPWTGSYGLSCALPGLWCSTPKHHFEA